MKATISILLVVLFMLSCNKEPDMTDSGILVSKRWKIDSVLSNGHDTNSECMKDDCYTFNKDGSLVISHGAVKCGEVEPAGGNYWFYDDETLVISSNGDRIYYKIFVYTDEVVLISDATGTRVMVTYVPCD
jgi:hypothetical protein